MKRSYLLSIRTWFPRRVALLFLAVAVAALTGCGEGSKPANDGNDRATLSEVEQAKGTVQVLSYQFYDEPKTEDSGPVKSEWAFAPNDSSLIVSAKQGGADLISPDSSIMPQLKALGLLKPIDTDLLYAYRQIPTSLREDPIWKEKNGDTVAIPIGVEPGATAWDSSKVPEPKTMRDLLKPIYRNSIAIYDDPVIVAAIANALGVKDTTRMTKEQLGEVESYLEELKPNIRALFSVGEDTALWNRGEISVEYAGFGTLGQAMEQNSAIKLNLLGSNIYPVAWSLTSGDSEAASLNWINNFLSVKTQKAFARVSAAIPVIPAARPTVADASNPFSRFLAEIGLPRILREEPIDRGFVVESSSQNIVTFPEIVAMWNNFKASF